MKLLLYHRWGCPHCEEVRNFIQDHELESFVDYIDIQTEAKDRFDLLDLSGSLSVPCLVIEGTPFIGSDLIKQWFKENLFYEGDQHGPPI